MEALPGLMRRYEWHNVHKVLCRGDLTESGEMVQGQHLRMLQRVLHKLTYVMQYCLNSSQISVAHRAGLCIAIVH